MCSAKLDGGPLVCTLGDHPDNPRGHVFHGTTGSDVPDRHDATSGGEH